jgi:pimeloyl-ACP methyl ester carboxylesterase
LPAIRCKILCIQGEDDEYGTIAQVRAIQARVPATEIVMLPNCKHSAHRDQAQPTLERMVEFVAEVEGSEEAVSRVKAVVEERVALPE